MRRLLSPRFWWKLPLLWDRLVAYCEGGWRALAVLLEGHPGPRRRKPLRPVFEMLETRYAPATRIWDGGGTTNNWSDAANWDADTAPVAGDSLVFDDTGVGVRSTSNNDLASFSVADVQLVNTTGAYTLTGNALTVTTAITLDLPTGVTGTASLALNGAAALTKSGAGTAVLTGANGFTGTTTVSGGVLQVGNGGTTGSLSSSSAVSVSSGAQFVFHRGNTSEVTFGSALSGSGTVEAKGPGTSLAGQYVFSGSNSGFSGSFVVTSARVRSGGAGNFGSAAITVNSGGQVYGVSGANFTQSITINGVGWTESAGTLGALRLEGGATWSGPITLGGNARIGTYNGNTGNVTGAISGAYELELWAGGSGNGTLNLTPGSSHGYSSTRVSGSVLAVAGNTNAFSTGGLTMNGGTLRLNGNNLSFANVQGSSGAIRNNSTSAAATLTVGGDNSSTTFSGTFADGSSQSLAVTKIGSGIWTLSGANTHTGTTTINGGTIKAGSGAALGSVTGGTTVASGATLDINGQNLGSEVVSIAGTGIGGNGAIVNTGSAQTNALRFVALTAHASVGGTSRWDVRGTGSQIDLAGYKLTKVGSSQVGIVTATVTSGDIDVNQGTLFIHAGTTIAGTGTLTVASGATLDVGNFGTAINVSRPITLSGGTLTTNASGGVTTIASPITFAATTSSTIVSPTNANLTLSGNLTGSGNVTKSGAHSVFLGGDNSGFSGTFTNSQSNVFFSSATAGSAAAAWAFSGTGNFFGINVAGATVALGSLSGTSGQILNAAGGNATFSIGGRGTNTMFSGTIVDSTGTLSIAKTGAGTLTLGGANTFSGTATIGNGAVEITSAQALGSTAGITDVANGAQLRFNGSSLTIAEPLTLRGVGPGNGAAVNVAGNTTLTGMIRTPGADALVRNEAIGTTFNITAQHAGPADLIVDGNAGGNVVFNRQAFKKWSVTLGSKTQGETGGSTSGELVFEPNDWVDADDWKAAVAKAVSGSITLGSTPYAFPASNRFAVGTVGELRTIPNNSLPSYGLADTVKVIVFEDWTDGDYDDWYWVVDVVLSEQNTEISDQIGCCSVGTSWIGGNAAGSHGGAPAMTARSAANVNVFTGVASAPASDLESRLGMPFAQKIVMTNDTARDPIENGVGAVVSNWPKLLTAGNYTLGVVQGMDTRWFDLDDSNAYVPKYFGQDQLTHDAANHRFILIDTVGTRTEFWDFDASLPSAQRGMFKGYTDVGGNVLSVSRNGGGDVTEVMQTVTTSGTTTVESYLYTYYSTGANAGQLATVTLRRDVNGAGYATVRSIEYTYYDGTDANGNLRDLKTTVVKDAAGAVIDTRYLRYYKSDASPGFTHGVKYSFGAASFARLSAAYANPYTASDTQVAPYADVYYEYDAQHRVTKTTLQGDGCSSCTGGLGTYTYNYSAFSGFSDGYNTWKFKTTETLPDGNQNISYVNAYGAVILKVYKDTTTRLCRKTALFSNAS